MPTVTACSTLAFSLSSLETALAHISSYGFDKVEISDQLTHSKHFSTDASRSVDPVEVTNLLDKYCLTPVAANCTLATFYTDQSGLERAPVEKQSSAETEEIKRAKQDLVFRVIVPEECVGERCELLHSVNLTDIDIDLGDVMPTADVIAHLKATAD